MKNLSMVATYSVAFFMAVSLLSSCGTNPITSNNKNKIKELQSKGWEIDDPSRTLEYAILQHTEKLKKNPKTILGRVSYCEFEDCASEALLNAQKYYAEKATAKIKEKTVGDKTKIDRTIKKKLFEAYTRNVEAEVGQILELSYALKKKNGSGYSYDAVFFYDEEKASQMRKSSMKRALEETKLSIEYGLWIEKFVNEDPLKK